MNGKCVYDREVFLGLFYKTIKKYGHLQYSISYYLCHEVDSIKFNTNVGVTSRAFSLSRIFLLRVSHMTLDLPVCAIYGHKITSISMNCFSQPVTTSALL